MTWFEGAEPRDDGERVFLARLREHAAAWDLPGITPDLTASRTVIAPLYVEITLPWVPPGRGLNTLQAGFWSGDDPRLECEWGDQYLLDGATADGALAAIGLRETPEQYAGWAAAWFERQAARPVVRDEWCRGDVVIARRWRLADTDTVVATEGRWWHRQGPPRHTERVH